MSAVSEAAARGGGLRFRLGGFTVHVPWNALIGIAIIALLWFPEFTSARTPLGQAALAAVFGVLLMLSVLLHELAHAVTARGFGYPVMGITLWAMGGFTTFRTPRGHGPGREAAIAAAGPAATLAVAAVSWWAAAAVQPGVVEDLLLALTSANLLVGLFNLLPGSPLDGGAIVKAAVWAVTGSPLRGQVVAGWIGRVLAVVLAASPFLLALWLGAAPSLSLVAVGLMLALILWSGASAQLQSARSSARLTTMAAIRLARPVVLLPHSATIADALQYADGNRYLLVLDEAGALAGVVSPHAADSVPAAARATTAALTACVSVRQPATLPADATAADVVDVVQATGSRFVLLARPGAEGGTELAGLIDTEAAFTGEES